MEGEDGDALIVKRARHRPRDVAWDYGDEAGCQQPRTLVPQLPGQQERGDGSQAAEHGCQKDTHITDVNCDVEQVEHVVDKACSHHQPWVYLRQRGREAVRNGKRDLRGSRGSEAEGAGENGND